MYELYVVECQDAPQWADFCVQWAADGRCTADPLLMATNCARTCNVCPPPPATTAALQTSQPSTDDGINAITALKDLAQSPESTETHVYLVSNSSVLNSVWWVDVGSTLASHLTTSSCLNMMMIVMITAAARQTTSSVLLSLMMTAVNQRHVTADITHSVTSSYTDITSSRPASHSSLTGMSGSERTAVDRVDTAATESSVTTALFTSVTVTDSTMTYRQSPGVDQLATSTSLPTQAAQQLQSAMTSRDANVMTSVAPAHGDADTMSNDTSTRSSITDTQDAGVTGSTAQLTYDDTATLNHLTSYPLSTHTSSPAYHVSNSSLLTSVLSVGGESTISAASAADAVSRHVTSQTDVTSAAAAEKMSRAALLMSSSRDLDYATSYSGSTSDTDVHFVSSTVTSEVDDDVSSRPYATPAMPHTRTTSEYLSSRHTSVDSRHSMSVSDVQLSSIDRTTTSSINSIAESISSSSSGKVNLTSTPSVISSANMMPASTDASVNAGTRSSRDNSSLTVTSTWLAVSSASTESTPRLQSVTADETTITHDELSGSSDTPATLLEAASSTQTTFYDTLPSAHVGSDGTWTEPTSLLSSSSERSAAHVTERVKSDSPSQVDPTQVTGYSSSSLTSYRSVSNGSSSTNSSGNDSTVTIPSSTTHSFTNDSTLIIPSSTLNSSYDSTQQTRQPPMATSSYSSTVTLNPSNNATGSPVFDYSLSTDSSSIHYVTSQVTSTSFSPADRSPVDHVSDAITESSSTANDSLESRFTLPPFNAPDGQSTITLENTLLSAHFSDETLDESTSSLSTSSVQSAAPVTDWVKSGSHSQLDITQITGYSSSLSTLDRLVSNDSTVPVTTSSPRSFSNDYSLPITPSSTLNSSYDSSQQTRQPPIATSSSSSTVTLNSSKNATSSPLLDHSLSTPSSSIHHVTSSQVTSASFSPSDGSPVDHVSDAITESSSTSNDRHVSRFTIPSFNTSGGPFTEWLVGHFTEASSTASVNVTKYFNQIPSTLNSSSSNVTGVYDMFTTSPAKAPSEAINNESTSSQLYISEPIKSATASDGANSFSTPPVATSATAPETASSTGSIVGTTGRRRSGSTGTPSPGRFRSHAGHVVIDMSSFTVDYPGR